MGLLPLLAETAADVRTALATEHLVTATWALVGVGVLTLAAAVAAAVAAVRAYNLEARPGVTITAWWNASAETPRAEQHFVAKELVDGGPGVRLVGGRTTRVAHERHQLQGGTTFFVAVTNVGRTPVVGLKIHVDLSAPAIVGIEDLGSPVGGPRVEEMTGRAVLDAASVQPGSTIVIPVVFVTSEIEMTVASASRAEFALGDEPRRRVQVPFVADRIHFTRA